MSNNPKVNILKINMMKILNFVLEAKLAGDAESFKKTENPDVTSINRKSKEKYRMPDKLLKSCDYIINYHKN